MAIGETDLASQRRIAGDRSVRAHQRAPEERHQLLAARGRVGRPESLVDRRLLDLLLRPSVDAQHVDVEPAKHLLGARAVERDEHHVVRQRLSRCPARECEDED